MNISKTDCDSPTGITVGLVDTIINSFNLLGERDLSPVDVQEALKDLMSNPMVLSLLNVQMGDAIKQAEYESALKTAEAELQQARAKIADLEYRNEVLRGWLPNPDWDNAPEDAEWFAVDKDGRGWWYSQKPVFGERGFLALGFIQNESVMANYAPHSLTKRPM